MPISKKKYIIMATQRIKNNGGSKVRNIYAEWFGAVDNQPHRITEDRENATEFSALAIADLIRREYDARFVGISFKVIENVSEQKQ